MKIEMHLCLPGLALYSISAAFCFGTGGCSRKAASDTGRMRGKDEWDMREGSE